MVQAHHVAIRFHVRRYRQEGRLLNRALGGLSRARDNGAKHEIEFEKENKKFKTTSTLKLIGDDDIHTAMAKTVGLPLGIAAKLILNEAIQLKGLHVPTTKEIYEPVLKELELHGILFKEQTEALS